ncbi:MAG: beta-N-acetylhexosaminidase [Bacteroidia bacterium]
MFKKIFLWLLASLIIIGALGFAYYRFVIYQPPVISAEDRAAINVMPLPAKLSLAGSKVSVQGGVKLETEGPISNLLQTAFDRFSASLNAKISEPKGDNLPLIIRCGQAALEALPQMGQDESYQLVISEEQIELSAPTPFGILHGLETLLQLTQVEYKGIYLPTLVIEDTPRFPWRGLMIDVSRHWIPKEIILRNLDAMAAVKLNVLHWHLSDDQGFRVESKLYNKLHQFGSGGNYYTQDDIREVVNYAAARGIRVVPEFDVPGHTHSWLVGYPKYAAAKGPFSLGKKGKEIFSVPMDPSNSSVYVFLDKLIGEMVRLFPDAYFHIGGDEVNPKYWIESLEIQTFMKEHDMSDPRDLQTYFNERLHGILQKHGKTMLGWDEIMHPELAESVVIQAWRNHKVLFEGVQAGGTGIISAGWYLDHKLPAGKHYQVDPMVLPGAVDVVPDTNHWRMYDIVMDLPSGEMAGKMVLFDRDPNNVSGFFSFLDQLNGFKNAAIDQDGKLVANFKASVGELTYTAQLDGDSLTGEMAFGFLKMDSHGHRIGGHDMEGEALPEIEVVRPLTVEEQARILGGEACMWTEAAGAPNVESRIWPRTAAIAEKLWSPQDLTLDEDDMYRRLIILDDRLAERGLQHQSQLAQISLDLAQGNEQDVKALNTLLEVLEEVKYYNRLGPYMTAGGLHWPDLAIDRVVDAARPESFEAREFNDLAAKYAATKSVADKSLIISRLKIWTLNHTVLADLIKRSPKVQEIENLSSNLATLSEMTITQLNDPKVSTPAQKEQAEAILQLLENGENGVLVAVVPGIRALWQ